MYDAAMELFHLLNRGVDKRTIFTDQQDYARFVHDLFEFNDTAPATPLNPSRFDLRSPTFGRELRAAVSPRPRERLVDIHGWCLMRNHYHLLLSERVEGGITKFIRKLNIGYAKYFNERYRRSGTLFQGRTKKIYIEEHGHFLYILHYLHLNPLDYKTETKQWREGKITGEKNALSYLDKYRWSSYLDYSGKKNFPSILTTSLFGDLFRNYKKELSDYVHDMDIEKTETLSILTLE